VVVLFSWVVLHVPINGRFPSGGAARVWRRHGGGSGARVRGEGGGAVRGSGLNRPGETRLSCGPAGKVARHGLRGRTRLRLGCSARRAMMGGARPLAAAGSGRAAGSR
jgi:hypothetical protein